VLFGYALIADAFGVELFCVNVIHALWFSRLKSGCKSSEPQSMHGIIDLDCFVVR
jgi:hypothetical protein